MTEAVITPLHPNREGMEQAARAKREQMLRKVRALRPGALRLQHMWRTVAPRETVVRYEIGDGGKRKRITERQQPTIKVYWFPNLRVTRHGPARYSGLLGRCIVLTDEQVNKLPYSALVALDEAVLHHFNEYDTTNGAGTHLA